MPWSLKAAGLLRKQYAAVGAAAGAVFPGAVAALEARGRRGVDVSAPARAPAERAADAAAFTEAYRRYCWTTDGLDGVRLAPFQILAVQGRRLAGLPHDEQLALLDRLVAADATGLLQAHAPAVVDTARTRRRSRRRRRLVAGADRPRAARAWSSSRSEACVRDGKGRLVQPGVKCRGREYLRIIYGPEYTRPEHLERLRARSLGHKRSLALREYALGLEALDRLAEGEPLWRIHEAVFAVLALESEPVDPRL